ncbi:MAG: glycosyltransferase family 4 protein, partial [Actinomycetota bacterium]|nr:glycosyltransferase family 4 protein [Actinomycetota bacterium]
AGLGESLIVPAADVDALAGRLTRARQGELPSREQTRAWAEAHSWKAVAEAHRELFGRVASGDGETSRKLRVVYLDHVSLLSGGELAMLRLLTALTEVEAHVILAEEGPLVDHLLQAGISVEVLPLHGRTRELRKDNLRPGHLPLRATSDTLAYCLRLAWRLRRLRPDVVHTNSLKSGIYGSIAARLAGVPVVWQLNDRIDSDYLPPLAVTLVRALTRHLADVVISNSQTTKQTLSPRTRSTVVPPIVGLAASGLHKSGPDSPLVVGMIGRLAPWKGQDVFLRAFARAFPQGRQRAVIVGAALFGGAEIAYGESLRHLAENLGVASRVEFRGHREDIVGELRSMDILVHASTIPEPFGMVVIEGMSARLPVVASRSGGPEEIITHGADGLLYPPGDVAALAQILRQLEADPQLRAQLGGAAERRARDFSPDSIAEQIVREYELVRPARSAAFTRR